MKGKPVGTHILIKPIKEEEVNGILIQGEFDYKKGEVIALGSGVVEGAEKIQFDIEEGDVVYYTGKHGEITVEGDTFGLIRHGQITYAE